MLSRLTPGQKKHYDEFRDFVAHQVVPYARQWDKDQAVPRDVIAECSRAGYVGGIIPTEFDGGGWDYVTFGLMNEAFGAGSASLNGLYTVQTMVAMSLLKWGTEEQKNRWLKPMAKGKVLASFAMTEPGVGSDIQAIETQFKKEGNNWILEGTKRWITYSGLADIYLVFGKHEEKSMACIIQRDTPGFTVTPITDMLGFRGAYLSQLDFNRCVIPEENFVGRPGFALPYVAPYGLHYGRMSTAWSSAGLIRACVEAGATHSSQRKSFDKLLRDHGMVRRLITDMGVSMEAARHLCLNASIAEDQHSPTAIEKTLIAKYYASMAASHAASDAVQLLGAQGCNEESPTARYYRDAKIMEIIEGTNEIQQTILGKSFCKKFSAKPKRKK
jgi:glutaryl-CoA dehydrogenase (non-decarboxylating)